MPSPQKASPGQKISDSPLFSAGFINDTIDNNADFKQRQLGGRTGPGSVLLGDSNVVSVRNVSGGDLDRGSVLQIGDDLLDEVDPRHIWFEADEVASPVEQGYAILLVPIKDGEIGAAQMAGVCVALVDITDTTHRYATPETDETILASAAAGPIEILSAVTTTGEQSLAVRLQVPGTGYVWGFLNEALSQGGTASMSVCDYDGSTQIDTGVDEDVTDNKMNVGDADIPQFTRVDAIRSGGRLYLLNGNCDPEDEGNLP